MSSADIPTMTNGQESGKKNKRRSKVSNAPEIKENTKLSIAKVSSKPEGPLELIEDSILKWQVPINDGGSPIEHYIVEQQVNGEFKELKRISRTTEPRIDLANNLVEESFKDITFRIKAFNLKGASEPLIESISLNSMVAKNSTLNVSAQEFVPFSPRVNNSLNESSIVCEPSLEAYESNGSYLDVSNLEQSVLYLTEINTILEECVHHHEPRQFERFIEEQSPNFAEWITCPYSSFYAASKFIDLSSMSSDEWHNFRYFGAKICSQIIRLNSESTFFEDVYQICSEFVDSIQMDNLSIKGFMLFLAELYKLLENQEQKSRIGLLLLKALHTLVSSPYDQENSKITIVVTILKCCGYILYPNHTSEIEQLFVSLVELRANCSFKDQKMIESLENCKQSWQEDVESSQYESGTTTTNEPSFYNNVSPGTGMEEVFYGPDGTETFITLEESQFFEESYRELDGDEMSEEMHAEYEIFLADMANNKR